MLRRAPGDKESLYVRMQIVRWVLIGIGRNEGWQPKALLWDEPYWFPDKLSNLLGTALRNCTGVSAASNICVYIYVYMYMYMYIYICTCTCLQTDITCIQIYIHACIHVYGDTYILCIHTCTCWTALNHPPLNCGRKHS